MALVCRVLEEGRHRYEMAGVGTPSGRQMFFSTAHGSGRTMDVRSASWSGLAEEAGGAYKNIDEVVEATECAGISKRVVRASHLLATSRDRGCKPSGCLPRAASGMATSAFY